MSGKSCDMWLWSIVDLVVYKGLYPIGLGFYTKKETWWYGSMMYWNSWYKFEIWVIFWFLMKCIIALNSYLYDWVNFVYRYHIGNVLTTQCKSNDVYAVYRISFKRGTKTWLATLDQRTRVAWMNKINIWLESNFGNAVCLNMNWCWLFWYPDG